MKVCNLSKLIEITGDHTESIIGNSQLWSDFKKDYPQMSWMIDSDPDDRIMDVILPVIGAYIKGWMRSGGKIQTPGGTQT